MEKDSSQFSKIKTPLEEEEYLKFLVIFSLGCRQYGVLSDYFEKELRRFVLELSKMGYSNRKINFLVSKFSGGVRFGFESVRVCKRTKF